MRIFLLVFDFVINDSFDYSFGGVIEWTSAEHAYSGKVACFVCPGHLFNRARIRVLLPLDMIPKSTELCVYTVETFSLVPMKLLVRHYAEIVNLTDAFNALPINIDRKGAITGRTENFCFIDI